MLGELRLFEWPEHRDGRWRYEYLYVLTYLNEDVPKESVIVDGGEYYYYKD